MTQKWIINKDAPEAIGDFYTSNKRVTRKIKSQENSFVAFYHPLQT